MSYINKQLLVISPHFKVFIRDQIIALKPNINGVSVMMPTPYLSAIARSIPLVNQRFDFVHETITSEHTQNGCQLFFPKFLYYPIGLMRKRNNHLAYKSCLKSLSKKQKFDFIHAHFLGNGYIGAKLKEKNNIPLVVTAHGVDVYDLPFRDVWYGTLFRYVLNQADQIITVSNFNSVKLHSLGVCPKKIHVIPNGFNEKAFKSINPSLAKKKIGLPFSKRIILSIGNLVDVKGHTYLIDAMSVVAKKQENVMLVILGSGPLKKVLEKKVKDLALTKSVFLLGLKSHEEIPTWMNACDIFVLPSLNEGFPTVIPEAMACGKPVIGTKVGGVPEALSNQDVGVLVNPRDPEALADTILDSLKKKWQADLIENYARQYSSSILVQRILGVYQTLTFT